MAELKNKGLDPRLRRIVASEDRPDRLRADARRNVVIATAELPEAGPVAMEELSKRVLVRLSRSQPPAAMADLDWVEIVDRTYAVEVPLDRLEALAAAPEVDYVEAGRELAPALSSSVPETRADRVVAGPPGLDGSGVAVGIIDFGLDFTLDDFRDEDGTTRVAFLWDQGLAPQAGEASPARFGYGVEYDREAIDAALSQLEGGGGDPFAAVRHRPGTGSHGTHVAGTAAGNGRSGDADFPAGDFAGVAPGATVIFVQPKAGDQTTTFTDSVHVAEAVAYIFEKADELGLPCVINMSLGQNGGSHDGESVVERAIDRLLEQPGRAMTVAAGNEHVWRGHAGGRLAEGESRVLRWQFGGGLPLAGGGAIPLGGQDITPNEMEIWYSSRDRLRVRVTHPEDGSSEVVEPGQTVVHVFQPSGDVCFIDSERFTVLNGDARIYIETGPSGGFGTELTRGEWRVEIEPVGPVRDGRFDAWIERDARRRDNLFADQSFFLGTDFDGVATLGTPSTGRRSIAVANYDHRVQSPSDSSGRGRTRDHRDRPQVAAPGTGIFSSCSLGGRPDGNGGTVPVRISMSGTSMAAPHVAGIAALLLQRDGRLTADQVSKILAASVREVIGVTHFDAAWGFGRVDAETAIDLVG